MPSYQFVTYETYNLADSADVFNEAMRVPGYCNHVQHPQPPTIVYGDSPFDILKDLQAKAEGKATTHYQTNKAGERVEVTRRMRPEQNVLLSGVISIPRDWDEENPDMAKACLVDAVKELKRRYGSNLRGALIHNDESNRHIHFYVYDDSLKLEKVCTATAAEVAIDRGKKKETGPERYKARSKALVTFQDEWFNNVFAAYGFARLGPKRRRESRSVALANRMERETTARQNFDTKKIQRVMSKAVAGISGVMMMQEIRHRALQNTMSEEAKLRHQNDLVRAAVAAGHEQTLSSIGL